MTWENSDNSLISLTVFSSTKSILFSIKKHGIFLSVFKKDAFSSIEDFHFNVSFLDFMLVISQNTRQPNAFFVKTLVV